MFTCTKEYKDIPFAHRQPVHDGHCALIHGHNWGVIIEFQASELDECGFVVDFGKLKMLKRYLDTFDHALVINDSDSQKETLLELEEKGLARIVIVDSCSSEGLALHFYNEFSKLINETFGERVTIKALTVTEDSKNSATFYA